MPDLSRSTPPELLPPRVRWMLVLGLFCLYLAVWPQGRGSVDEEYIYRTTYSLVHRGSLTFAPVDEAIDADVAAGKRVASKFGVLPSVAAVPFHMLGLGLARLAPDALRDDVLRTATYSSSGLWMALAALQVAAALGAMGFARKVQLTGALLFALATPALVYARFFHVAAMATLLVAALFHAAVRFAERPDGRRAAWLGGWLGLLLLVGFNFAVLAPIVAVFAGWASTRTSARRRIANVAAVMAPVAVGWALTIGVNLLRGHDWFRGGYVGETFVTPLVVGLYGLLFSAGRGLFFYSPLCVLGVLLFPAMWRKRRRLAWLAAATCVVVTVSYAKWFAWNGGTYWGPRYLVPLLPLTVVPLAYYLAGWKEKPVAGRTAFALIVVVALAVQARGVWTHYYAAMANVSALVRSENEPLFVAQLEPLWWQADAPASSLWADWYRRDYRSLAIAIPLVFSAAALGALGYAAAPVWKSLPGAVPGPAWGWVAAGVVAMAVCSIWRSTGHGLSRNAAVNTLPPVDFQRPRWKWQAPASETPAPLGPTTWIGYLRVPQNGNYVLFLRSAGSAVLSLEQKSGPEVPVQPRIDHPGGSQWHTWAGRLNVGLYRLELAAARGPAGPAEVSLLWTMHGGGIDRQPIDPQYLYPVRPSRIRLVVDRVMGMAWLGVLWVGLAVVALGGMGPDQRAC